MNFFHTILFLTIFIYSTTAQVPQSERDALIALYNSTNGDDWLVKTNWDTDPNSISDVSTWFGITVNEGHVTKVVLTYNNLQGIIPPEISDLNLKEINLDNNQLTGGVEHLANMISLRILSLNTNNFTGEISANNLINLSAFYIRENDFTRVYLQNGYNEDVYYFATLGNPNLTCIFIDDVEYVNEDWRHDTEVSTYVQTQAECDALVNNVKKIEDLKDHFSIYPIPLKNQFSLVSDLKVNQIELFDVTGKRVIQTNKKSFNVSHLVKGTYILKIMTEHGIFVKKIIK